jgi:ligand-binding SRPBCC domain-containing protein
MKIHRITDEIEIDLSLDEAWAFFADPHNLQKLTPDDMGFKHVLEPDKDEVYPGMIMSYKIAPIAGIPLNWVTEITQVEPKTRFVDEQRQGPFGFWHHIHEFEARGNRTLCRDALYYRMPFGFLGNIAHALFAKKQIANIFAFRKEKMKTLF